MRSPNIEKKLDFLELSEINRKEQKAKLSALRLLKIGNPLIATLAEEMKPVVSVKDAFACRDKSKKNSILWNFRTIKILMRGKNQWFDLSIDFDKSQVFERDQNGRHQVFSYGELGVPITRWNSINSINWNIGWKSNARSKIKNITIENIYTTKKHFIETLIRKMKLAVMGDKGGWNWMSRKIIDRTFFGNFGLSGPLCNEQNQRFFTSILLYKCYVLDLLHDGGIRTCSGWGIRVCKMSEIKKVAHLGNFGLSRHGHKEHKSTILLLKKSLKLECFRYPAWSKR